MKFLNIIGIIACLCLEIIALFVCGNHMGSLINGSYKYSSFLTLNKVIIIIIVSFIVSVGLGFLIYLQGKVLLKKKN